MGIEAKRVSLWDTLRLQLFVAVPAFLWGLVAPNRRLVALLTRLDAGALAARLLDDLRRKYGCDHLWAWFPIRRTLLVLDPASIDAVLESDENAADPFLKARALGRLAPGGVIISSGHEWSERRRFNEEVLDFGRLHDHAEAFRAIVYRETEALLASRTAPLRWPDFQALAQRISQQVVLGVGQSDPAMAADLARLVGRANWPFLPRARRSFDHFYASIDDQLEKHRATAAPSPGSPASKACLLHESAVRLDAGLAGPSTRVPAQIGFWLFVIRDALELHVPRTLALIAGHSDVQERVRKTIRDAGLPTAPAIDALDYLNACLEEQLRLWTPVPILLRRAVKAFSLRGEIDIAAEQQVLIHTGFHHRDARLFGAAADRFDPDSASQRRSHVYFFSRHRQACAGQFLARFLLKSALAALLARSRFELVAPSIERRRIAHLCDHFSIELRPAPDA